VKRGTHRRAVGGVWWTVRLGHGPRCRPMRYFFGATGFQAIDIGNGSQQRLVVQRGQQRDACTHQFAFFDVLTQRHNAFFQRSQLAVIGFREREAVANHLDLDRFGFAFLGFGLFWRRCFHRLGCDGLLHSGRLRGGRCSNCGLGFWGGFWCRCGLDGGLGRSNRGSWFCLSFRRGSCGFDLF
jgi:hypothetical protein